MDAETAVLLQDQLDSYGLSFSGADLRELNEGQSQIVRLSHRFGDQDVELQFLHRVKAEDAWPRSHGKLRFILSPAIHERTAQHLRAAGTSYLDAGGNALIDFQGVHIDVRGRKSRVANRRDSSSQSGTNLFSTKRAQVIFALLTWPKLIDAPLRRIAMVAGVSVGQAQQTMALLEENGETIDAAPRRFVDEPTLFDRWVRAYASGLSRTLRIKDFYGDPHVLNPGERRLFLSGEVAMDNFMRGETATLYIDGPDPTLYARNRWRADREVNIFVRRKFWVAPDDVSSQPGVSLAPSTLIYADLIAADDGRQTEAAKWLRSHDDRLRQL